MRPPYTVTSRRVIDRLHNCSQIFNLLELVFRKYTEYLIDMPYLLIVITDQTRHTLVVIVIVY